jgi:hypothetical protein
MSASIHHFTAAAQRPAVVAAVTPAPIFRGWDYETQARAIGSARAARDLAAGTLPAGIDALDWWHMAEITGTPEPMLAPEEYRMLVGFADGGYWTAIDEAIPERPDTRAVRAADEDGEISTVDFSWIRIARPLWRARMDETLLILLDEAADRYHWTVAKFCAAYALLAGPMETARVFEDCL